LQLVLFCPKLGLKTDKSHLQMLGNNNETKKNLAEVLAFIRMNPNVKLGVAIIEALRNQVNAEALERELDASIVFFSAFDDKELQAEWDDTVKKFEQARQVPAKLDRKGELDFKAAHGGLTEAEKQEYLILLQRH
jgi:DNA primase